MSASEYTFLHNEAKHVTFAAKNFSNKLTSCDYALQEVLIKTFSYMYGLYEFHHTSFVIMP